MGMGICVRGTQQNRLDVLQENFYKVFRDELVVNPRNSFACMSPYLGALIYWHSGVHVPVVRPLGLYTGASYQPLSAGRFSRSILVTKSIFVPVDLAMVLNDFVAALRKLEERERGLDLLRGALGFLRGFYRTNFEKALVPLKLWESNHTLFANLKQLSDPSWSNWARHTAAVFLPYDPQQMVFYELYSMGVPLLEFRYQSPGWEVPREELRYDWTENAELYELRWWWGTERALAAMRSTRGGLELMAAVLLVASAAPLAPTWLCPMKPSGHQVRPTARPAPPASETFGIGRGGSAWSAALLSTVAALLLGWNQAVPASAYNAMADSKVMAGGASTTGKNSGSNKNITRGVDLTRADYSGKSLGLIPRTIRIRRMDRQNGIQERKVVGVSFQQSIVREGKFVNADVQSSSFFDADGLPDGQDLANADFTGANLNQVNFELARLSGAILDNAVATEMYVNGTTKMDVKSIDGADFTDTIFRQDQVNYLCEIAKGTNPTTKVPHLLTWRSFPELLFKALRSDLGRISSLMRKESQVRLWQAADFWRAAFENSQRTRASQVEATKRTGDHGMRENIRTNPDFSPFPDEELAKTNSHKMPPSQRRVLIIGGSFSGLAAGRDLGSHYLVTIIDAKDGKTATYKPIFTSERETIDFDYCIIAAGCNFGPFHKWGESLWFPTIHEDARPEGSWPHLDERYLEGRRRHVLEEFNFLKSLNDKSATCLVVGAGFIGVEWATEIQHFFPRVKLTIIDFLPQPLGPLPASAAKYCETWNEGAATCCTWIVEKYMNKVGIKQFYNTKYDAKNTEFWKSIDLPNGADKEYVCIGVKASNYFMPKETLSEKGPGGGGWILMNQNLSVKTRDGKLWGADDKGFPRIYAVGDCNYGCIEEPGKKPDDWPIPPIPKISYPGEEMCIVACTNIEKTDRLLFQSKTVDCCGDPLKVWDMHWPWGAGMFATSLGPDDACFVAGANWQKNSGLMCVWVPDMFGTFFTHPYPAWVAQDECAYGFIGRCIWYFVHHTPVHLFGGGPRWGY
eukprot:g15529.t2